MSRESDIQSILRLQGTPKAVRMSEGKKLNRKPARWLRIEAKRLQGLAKAESRPAAQVPEVQKHFGSYNDNRCTREEWSNAEY